MNSKRMTAGRAATAGAKPANAKTATKGSLSAKTVVKASAPKASAKRDVTFAVYEPRAGEVFVSGAFNDWQPTPLSRTGNRDWKATVSLVPGRYEYKFVVDGKWKVDPRSQQFSPNAFGTLNSVIEVKA
jgi:1,4-alpha-glucan branching enzyme